ncbi:DNA polymerase III subunit alpha [Candidatus Nomurabacteria bacterium]|nr:DNA polymerase III subunit alpha [Candidatus Nomurabacteria bacterium]
MSETSFVHLHVHSHYSLLDGLSKIPELVKKARSHGMPALALTDHGNLYGAIEFYKECVTNQIKPIIGVEAYVATRGRTDKEPHLDARRFHLTLLAKNLTGYKNLLKLVSQAYLEGFYYKPRIDKELLRAHHEGLICLSGCLAGELSRAVWNKNQEEAKKVATEYQEIFGAENYFIEIMHHPKIERQLEIKKDLIALAKELNIPLVGTQDTHYLEPTDAEAQDTLVAIQTGAFSDETKRFTNKEEDFSLISPTQALEYFQDAPEAVENTLKIAAMCDLKLELGKWVFPNFPVPAGSNYDMELENLGREKLTEYLAHHVTREAEAKTRFDYELGVITKKGYSPYFLVVADIISYARANGIFTNTRGSAAGSFISFLIGITNVDPLFYELPFERFLNAERPSPPDIDMDFADKRRDEIIDYVRQKYGPEKVSQIGTFGSMLARGSVRDVARALGFPYGVGDKISRLVPLGSQGFPMTINRALDSTPELKELYEKDKDTQKIIDLAKKIEGGARHISVHAAGVVISPTELTDYVPLQLDPKGGKTITQYDMHAVEDAGLLKFDFLGIRNLSILEDSVRLVRQILKEEIEIEKIALDDKKTFQMLARGETIGLFQLNGSGMTKWLKELKPSNIFDINAMVALYRPGPMESIPEYIKRKHNPSLVRYLDPRMKDILKHSHGVLTYQDDVMLVAIQLGGYSWVEADKLRKAMGKKIPKEMEAQREKLLAGLVKNGMSKKKAEELWHLIEPFAAYGFNKAHAASYGRVAYQTAYMKANYPAEYMTAVLSAEAGNIETIGETIKECGRMKLPVLPPDVNESFDDFTVVKNHSGDKIRFGLITIKNLGTEIAKAVVEERQQNGNYQSIANFLERIKHKNLNRKSLEALIKAGALDSLGDSRATLLANLEQLIAYHQETLKTNENQDSLFGQMSDQSSIPQLRLNESQDVDAKSKLAWEKELLGLYISGHPLDAFGDKFKNNEHTISRAKEFKEGASLFVGGIIEDVRSINTKKGDQMAFVRLSDYTGSIECVVFSRTYGQFKELLHPERCVAIKGRLSVRNNEPSVVVESLKELV